MKVTFIVYSYRNNSISLVQANVGKNKPTAQEWKDAAQLAMEKVGGDVGITAVLRGLVVYEEEAPEDFGNLGWSNWKKQFEGETNEQVSNH